jgi:hypothetical protein
MPNSIIANSIMGRKIYFPELFRTGAGCYCLLCEDKRVSNIDVNDNKQLFWF